MIFLNRSFNDFMNIEVYEYYDKSLLFSFRMNEDLYLALLVEEKRSEYWYVIQVSSKRFNEAINGFIDIYTMFKKVESGEVHKLGVSINNNHIHSEQIIKPETINDCDLPDRNEFLL